MRKQIILVLLLAFLLPGLLLAQETDENAFDEAAAQERTAYPVEWIYGIIAIALILGAVTYYLYFNPGKNEVRIKPKKPVKKKKKKAKKATRKR